MIDSIHYLMTDLKSARLLQKLSQRKLAEKTGIPQGQISRIENATVDLKTSTLVALARALGFEVVLLPRKHLTAVRALLNVSAQQRNGTLAPKPAYAFDDEEADA